jgi:hypothetical protein
MREFKPLPSLHLGLKFGLSMYDGTLDAANQDRSPVGGGLAFEVAYQFNNFLGIGGGLDAVSHPRLTSPKSRRTTQLFVRLQHASARVAPYLKLGANYAGGGDRAGFGPLVGVGVNVFSGGTYSIYQETTFNLVYPGDAVDGMEGANAYDALGFVGFGLRITDIRGFFGRRKIDIITVRGNRQTAPGVNNHYEVETSQVHPISVSYTWNFDDGTVRHGQRVEHVFQDSGLHTVTVSASNGGITSRRSMLVHVAFPVETVPPSMPATREPVEIEVPTAILHSVLPYTWVVASYDSLHLATQAAQVYGPLAQVQVFQKAQLEKVLYLTTAYGGVGRYLITFGRYATRGDAIQARGNLPEGTSFTPWIWSMAE